jgi:hypothetical protein
LALFSRLFIWLSNLVLFIGCQNTNLYYSAEEVNFEIFKAFVVKDQVCGSTHNLTGFIPGRVKKLDLDNCIKSIQAKDCASWNNSSDPTPPACLGINYNSK